MQHSQNPSSPNRTDSELTDTRMTVAIAGASGLVGTALAERLQDAGHRVVRLRRPGRNIAADGPTWDPAHGTIDDGALDGCDAVVNLAGASIGDGRWTKRRKRLLRDSRIDATRLLVDAMATMERRPRVLVSASAVGFYGDRGDDRLIESDARGRGFLAELAADWEAEAQAAEDLGVRVVTPRFGVILDRDAEALRRMMLPIRLGVGGPLGNGRQWMPWVTLADVTRAIEFFLTHEVHGAVNVVAPGEERNRTFTKALARRLHRPAILPAPGFALRLLLGQAADELLLASTRAEPARLTEAGFTFVHPDLASALPAVLAPRAPVPGPQSAY